MAMITEMQIKSWQQKAGIKLPEQEAQWAWRNLQETAFEAIKVAELEMSGIRDGDGYWHGGDVVGHILSDLESIIYRLKRLNGLGEPGGELANLL